MIPRIHVIRIPTRSAPFTFLITSTSVMMVPIRASATGTVFTSPRLTQVEGLLMTTPAFCKPMNAINIPIPTLTAFFMFAGMALKIASRTLTADKIIKMIPSTNTSANATCQLYPFCAQMVKAKYAFSPIPGARTKG